MVESTTEQAFIKHNVIQLLLPSSNTYNQIATYDNV